MELYNHQKKVIEEGRDLLGIAFGCGAGKTRTVLSLARKKTGRILVVAPKTQVLDKTWEKECEKMGFEPDMQVISKEQFKKQKPHCDILVLDEAHCFLGVTPATRYRKKVEIPKTSQLFEDVLQYIDLAKPKQIYLASATPFPSPLALWGSLKMFGVDIDYFAFRRKFYSFVPSIGRGVWLPRRDDESEEALVNIAKKHWVFGRLEDFFDVPDQVHKEIVVGEPATNKRLTKELRLLYPEPVVLVGKRHQLEQGLFDDKSIEENKTDEIVSLAKEFSKLLVFCKYTKQIDSLAEKPNKQTIVIAQSQVSTGYELPSFRCTVFASMSYSFVDYEQALGRTQRANNISKNVYVYLIAGEVDKAVLKCVQAKKDFSEKLFAQEI